MLGQKADDCCFPIATRCGETARLRKALIKVLLKECIDAKYTNSYLIPLLYEQAARKRSQQIDFYLLREE